MKRSAILVTWLLLPAAVAVGRANVELLDHYAEAARQQWNVPGLSARR